MESVIVTQPGLSAIAKFQTPLLEGAGDTPEDEEEKEKKKNQQNGTNVDVVDNLFTEPPIIITTPYTVEGSHGGCCDCDDCCDCGDGCDCCDCDGCCSCDDCCTCAECLEGCECGDCGDCNCGDCTILWDKERWN